MTIVSRPLPSNGSKRYSINYIIIKIISKPFACVDKFKYFGRATVNLVVPVWEISWMSFLKTDSTSWGLAVFCRYSSQGA
jgi:hypothetical protein